MGAMNKRELAKAVAVQADVELKTVVTVIDGFTEVVTAVVAKGEPISIPGFAKFVKVDRPARMGRNPATGEAIRIKASKKARITPVKAFKDAVLAPAKAPKLVKGAFPTERRGRRGRGQVRRAGSGEGSRPDGGTQGACQEGQPRRGKGARQEGQPRRRDRRRRPKRGREEVARHARARPNHSPTGRSRSHIPTGCRRATRPIRQILRAHDDAPRAGADTYLDPCSGLMVLTAGYLARRGFCCESGCRHCPYVSAESTAGGRHGPVCSSAALGAHGTVTA